MGSKSGSESLEGGVSSGFAGRESSNNRRNIDARAGETWLPEPHVGIH